MKKKWIIAVCAVVALGALVSTAVAHRGERMRDGRGMQAMMQELDLNAEQREQLRELRQTLREQMRDARDSGQEAMETVREVRRQALLGVHAVDWHAEEAAEGILLVAKTRTAHAGRPSCI